MKPDDLVLFEQAVDRLPKYNDDEPPKSLIQSNELNNIVHLSAEDYAGNFVLPSFGVIRPGADYYASNLKMYVFVIADLSLDKITCMFMISVVTIFTKFV